MSEGYKWEIYLEKDMKDIKNIKNKYDQIAISD